MADRATTPTHIKTRRRPKPSIRIATLREVAAAAGVSTASVSRALSRADLVSESLRDRVLAAAASAGYVANPAARALASRRSGLVGIVLAVWTDSTTVQALNAMQRRLAAAGLGTMLTIADDAGDAAAHADALASRGVDAIVFAGVGGEATLQRPDSSIARLRLDVSGIHQGVVLPGFDRGRAIVLAARYLKELGHRQIGVIAGYASSGGEETRASLASEGVQIATYAVEEHSDGMSARDAVRAVLAHHSNMTAIIGGSDLIAAIALREALAQRLQVPGDLSLVGFGDTELARLVSPCLTSVRVPARATGIAAADYLLSMLTDRPPVEVVLGGPKVAVRDSTAPSSR